LQLSSFLNEENNMQKSLCRKILVSLLITASTGCSSGPSGDYGGDDCGLFDKLSFRDSGKVYISMKMFGMDMGETAGDYSVDDRKVIITANNQTTVFTLNDNGDLEGSMLGEKIVCRKGGAKESAGAKPEKSGVKDSSSLSGSYGGMACVLDKMSFSDNGQVMLFIDNEQEPGTYRLKGDQVTVTGPGGSMHFTHKGDRLETMIEGQTSVCEKL
jgi:hypothetical protein